MCLAASSSDRSSLLRSMTTNFLIDGTKECREDQRCSKSVKLSFVGLKWDSSSIRRDASNELNSSEHSQSNRDRGVATKNVLLERILGGFRDGRVKAVKWIAENTSSMNLQDSRAEHFSCTPNGKAEQVTFRAAMGRRQLCFAKVTDSLDQGTKETIYELKEDVVDTAQKARVPVPQLHLPYIGFIHSLTVKDLLCGILAGAAAATISAPFEVVRSRVIAGQGGRTSAQVLTTVAREEGLSTLLKGSFGFNVVKTSLEKGLQFSTFGFVKRYEQIHREETNDGKFLWQKKLLPLPKKVPVATVGGAAAGFIGTMISYPLQPVVERLFLQPDKYTSLDGTISQILRHEGGFPELYRGITPALIAIVPSAALSFYSYETLKEKYLSKTNSTPAWDALQTLVIGGLAGAISTTITYPLEEARKQIVLSALSSKVVQVAGTAAAPNYGNTWQALNGIVKTEGWRGLYRGLAAQNAQIIPLTAISFMVYEGAKRAFVASGEERRDEVKSVDDLTN